MVKKIYKIVLDDRRPKVCELADMMKKVPYACKVMASVFWDTRQIISIDYLQKRKTINDEYYANLLQCLSDEIKKKRPHRVKKKVWFFSSSRWTKSIS